MSSVETPCPLPQLSDRGFTLVELAIVMTIIGLLIGGILKGQEMIITARVNATIAQVKGYEAAVTTFKDVYDAVPGDMPNASEKLPGCNANCNPFAAGAGNGQVGAVEWLGSWDTQTVSPMPLPPSSAADETTLFWLHLLKADMIGGITDAALRNQAATWGETHPVSKFSGGFVVGMGNGAFTIASLGLPRSATQLASHPFSLHDMIFTPAYAAGNGKAGGNAGGGGGGFAGPGCPGQGNGPGQGAGCGVGGGGNNNGGGGGGGGAGGGGGGGAAATSTPGPSGLIVVVMSMPASSGIDELSTGGLQPLTASMAAKIDRKMDDGFPHSGAVYAYGSVNSCFMSATDLRYNESITSRDCGLVFRIQK
ncbi:MAG: prepilin-type N-terminal cleavage/methylation domain-containing protein [Alphaproteobacteria bacterium]